MPYLPLVGQLVQSDRRSQWTALKSKHRRAIAAKKLDFNARLGPALDKYQAPVLAVDKLFAAERVSLPAVQQVLDAARPLHQIAQHYLDQVKGLGDPAETELATFLRGLITDCHGWEQVSDMFETAAVASASAVQVAAIKALYGLLDKLDGQLENLNKSLPAAQAELKLARTKTTKPNQAASLTPKEWTLLLRAKLDALAASAASLNTKRSTAQKDLAPLLTASTSFTLRSDYQSFKDRAQAVSATSLSAFLHQAHSFLALQSDPEIKSKLGFDKGLPGIQLRRASISAGAARGWAEKLLEGIHQLP